MISNIAIGQKKSERTVHRWNGIRLIVMESHAKHLIVPFIMLIRSGEKRVERITKHALPIAVIINVLALGIMIGLSGCEPTEGMKSDRTDLKGCVPTGLYVYESNPRGVHQVYQCGF